MLQAASGGLPGALIHATLLQRMSPFDEQINLRASGDLADVDLDRFRLVDHFAVALHDTTIFGSHVTFVDGAGEVLLSFPWWDDAEMDLLGWDETNIPLGTRERPFHDLEQSWEVFIFAVGEYVFVLHGPDCCSVVMDAWFKVRREDYLAAWRDVLRRVHADRRIATTLARALEAPGEVRKLLLRGPGNGHLDPAIGRLTGLEHLELHNRELTSLPDEIGNLDSLRHLSLQFNRFTEIPRVVFRLRSLDTLRVGHNQIARLPRAIGRLRGLRELEVSSNWLSALPHALFMLASLETLQASDNRIAHLPVHLGDLPRLSHLNIGANELPEAEQRRLVARYPGVNVWV